MKTLGDMIKHDLVSCAPGDVVLDVARRLAHHKLGALPVIDATRLVGILTEGDLLFKIVAENRDPAKTKVAEVMTRDPITASPSMPIEDAVEELRRRGFRRLPIVDGGRVVGLISLRDLFAAEVQDALQENYRLKMQMMTGD